MTYLFGENHKIQRDCAVTIGKFDAMHRGHMELIGKLKQAAAQHGLATAVMSLVPHPKEVLTGEKIPLILAPREKLYLLSQLGLDYYIEYPFNHQFAQIMPQDFIKNILFQQLRCRMLVVGENFRFGKDGAGDAAAAAVLGAAHGLTVLTLPLVAGDAAAVISSANVRRAVAARDFAAVRAMCGRDFFVLGDVAHGMKKGRTMAFRTANLAAHKDKLLPPRGVYATMAHGDGMARPGVTGIGVGMIETHILDFDSELHGRELRIDFLQWMRDMRDFKSFEDLAAQIEMDVAARRQIL